MVPSDPSVHRSATLCRLICRSPPLLLNPIPLDGETFRVLPCRPMLPRAAPIGAGSPAPVPALPPCVLCLPYHGGSLRTDACMHACVFDNLPCSSLPDVFVASSTRETDGDGALTMRWDSRGLSFPTVPLWCHLRRLPSLGNREFSRVNNQSGGSRCRRNSRTINSPVSVI